MLTEIQKVLQLLMMAKNRQLQQGSKRRGGLLILLWTEPGAAVKKLICTVAAAGPWCAQIENQALQHVLTDLKKRVFPSMGVSPEPEIEELIAFTDLHGSLSLLLSFQMEDARHCTSEWKTHVEAFMQSFSLANAEVTVHLKFKLNQQISQREFQVKIKKKVALVGQPSLILDITSQTQPPLCVKEGFWCDRGHPILGANLPLSIPPQVMDRGLFGDLSVQFVSILKPCVLLYPNLATELTRIEFLIFSPSNVPVPVPSGFFQTLPAPLDCQEPGLDKLDFKDLQHSGGFVYTVEREKRDEPGQESNLSKLQQSLQLLLFLQHNDPFISQFTDVVDTEILIEHHLEDILNNNKKAFTAVLQSELKHTLKVQNLRRKNQMRFFSAAEVILRSSISIVSCSTNPNFRMACMNSMKVRDTYELSASLKESLQRVISWKFAPSTKCCSAKMGEHPESEDPTRVEI